MRRCIAIPVVLLAIADCSRTAGAPPRLTAWPENPCAVLTAEEVAAATGLVVTNVRRAPSIAKLVQAYESGRDPGPGTYICVYETRSDYVDITIVGPPEDQRSSKAYWVARESYFRTFPGSARPIPNIGEDAWLAGGADLHVLARRDLHFAVTARMARRGADTTLIALARAVVAKF